MEDHVRRAFAAYFRTGGKDQPADGSGVRSIGRLDYVHLFNNDGTLAVYRVQPSGRLKALKRWPKAIEGRAA